MYVAVAVGSIMMRIVLTIIVAIMIIKTFSIIKTTIKVMNKN